ncbi:MAG: hypothetical protein ACRD0D_14580, partial [Acidimicrobiales bacterium]
VVAEMLLHLEHELRRLVAASGDLVGTGEPLTVQWAGGSKKAKRGKGAQLDEATFGDSDTGGDGGDGQAT